LAILTKLVAVGSATKLKFSTNGMKQNQVMCGSDRKCLQTPHTFGMQALCLQEYGENSKELITLHIQPPHLDDKRPTLSLKEGVGVFPMKAISILQNIQ
jgi:hypothetical protein